MERTRISTGTEWEPRAGYSRAVRVGPHVHVSGTTAWNDEGDIVGVGDMGAQTEQALSNVEAALERAGAELADVVRTRIYVTDIDRWEAAGDVHGEYFGEIRPASSLAEVSALVDDRLLVEVEAQAYVDDAA